MNDIIYHIYIKNTCIFNNLSEEEFDNTWKCLKNILCVLDSPFSKDELSYERIEYNKKDLYTY